MPSQAQELTHLRLHTEHSYRYASGRVKEILAGLPGDRASITDRAGTWGHVKWMTECKEAKKTPIYGVELAVVADMDIREKQRTNHMTFLARTDAGLREIYELTQLATEKMYYVPRVDYAHILGNLSKEVIILTGNSPEWDRLKASKKRNIFVERGPATDPAWEANAQRLKTKVVATVDNLYRTPGDRQAYEIIMGDQADGRTYPSHLLSAHEWLQECPRGEQHIINANELAKECNASLPKAELVHPPHPKTLRQMCLDGAKRVGCDLKRPEYKARLERELALIDEKKFEDYFYVVADMIVWAKERMFVGPARGSSSGSLVCWLLNITDIDPLPFDLLFERFIDVNREDLPDIDIDFPKDRRDLVFDYLREKYGSENIARLGTINVFKAKSALGLVAKNLQIPAWEITDLKNSIVERSTGDSRAAFCILDTFNDLEIGRATLAKHPELALAAELEGHASHTGQHAAGVLITAHPVVWYAAIDSKNGCAMLDKYDAEKVNLLKIDALGLRTLTIFQDCIDSIGWSRAKLQNWPLDDKRVLGILNQGKFAAVFQFEGYALQSLTKQMPVDGFEDIVSLTALARPGPLNSGGATEFLKRRTGAEEVKYLHPLCEDLTRVTYGVIVYQEQVMQIARTVGALSWEDVSNLRKAMSKSKGKEFFDKFLEKFMVGTRAKGIPDEQAQTIWDNINTMGSWAFNRSHAVAYGLMSYWSLVLKAYHPLEYAAACLREAKDDDQSIKILRELIREGYSYQAFDRHLSVLNWSVQKGKLVGGITAIKGIGKKLGQVIINKRDKGIVLTPREEKLMTEGTTPWDKVFECEDKWGHILKDPAKYGIASELVCLADITQESDGKFVFIAKVTERNLRDHNELQNLTRRGGKRVTGQTMFLNLTLEDDTGVIMASINRFDYLRIGLPVVEQGKTGDWYIWSGQNKAGFRKIRVQRLRKLTGNNEYANPEKESEKKGVDKVSVINESISASETMSPPNNKPDNCNNNMKNLATGMTRDIDLKTATPAELLAWYNENSGGTPIKKFPNAGKALERCKELYSALKDLASGASKPKGKGEKPKGDAGAPAGPRGKKSTNAGKFIYPLVKENPRRKDTHGFKSFEAIKPGMTYEEYITAGGRPNDLAYDVEHEFVEVRDKKK